MKSMVLRAGLATVFAFALAGARADGLQAGQWQVTQKAVVNGAAAPPRHNERCLSPADVSDLAKTFSPVARTTNSACNNIEIESTPQRLKWRLQCTGQLDMDVAGEYVFDTPQHYTGTINTSAAMLGRVIQSSQVEIEAVRVGECP